jgi:peptidoglycan/LPS O-acetylase OafA/YrhL
MHLGTSSTREDEESLLPSSGGPRQQQPILSRLRGWRAVSPRGILLSCLAFMRPSFLRPTGGGTSEKASSYSKTAYLDGVRGVAALIVFIFHWTLRFYPVRHGWGYKYDSLWLLPFVRLLFSGAAMVAVFFVVSGFVLAHRFIRRMHAGEYAELYAGLTSITFRRAVRLFLPAFVSSLMAFVCADLGLVKVPAKVEGEPFEHSLSTYIDYVDSESDPFTWDMKAGWYNPNLWTIAVEFRGSLVVFLLLLGLARCRISVRLLVEAVLIIYSFSHKRWDVALFIAGMALAEMDILLRKPTGLWRRRLVNSLLVLSLILGLFLAGYPQKHNTETPGYKWSKHTWPFTAYRRRFWLAMGALLIVGAMVFLPSVQSVFRTRPVRYLGRISFSLYLVHGLGNRTVGKAILGLCWRHIGKEGHWAFTISFVVSTALYFPILVWVSDMFWRAVDIPSMDLARWLEKKAAAEYRNTAKEGSR